MVFLSVFFKRKTGESWNGMYRHDLPSVTTLFWGRIPMSRACQSVMHCHIHVIPRYAGDIDHPRGGVRGVIPHKRDY
jgi:hypothetical protein